MLISEAEFSQPIFAVFIFETPKWSASIPLHKLAIIAVYMYYHYYHYIVELHFISIIISRVLLTLPTAFFLRCNKKCGSSQHNADANVIVFLRGISLSWNFISIVKRKIDIPRECYELRRSHNGDNTMHMFNKFLNFYRFRLHVN